MHIVCFGDSICYGDGVRPDQAWVSLLAGELARQRPQARVLNAGVNGETAQDGLRRLPMLLASPVPDVLYVQFGLNDAWQNICSAEEYADGVWEIVCRALESGVGNILAGTNHPVWLDQNIYEWASFAPRVRRFNDELRNRLAPALGRVALADIEALWDELGGRDAQLPLLQADGVHLSAEGNRAYAGMLLPVFMRLL
jgi:lysophospholipase L1-like esterase